MISYFAEKIGSAEGFSIKSVVPLRYTDRHIYFYISEVRLEIM